VGIISILALSHLTSGTRLFKRLRPRWTKSFLQEETAKDDELERINQPRSFIWSILLSFLATSVVVVEIIQLTRTAGLQPFDALPLISWLVLDLFVALTRPAYSPVTLLLVYISSFMYELSFLHSQPSSSRLQDAFHSFVALAALGSAMMVVCMPLRPISPISGPISEPGTTPSNEKRSPEDSFSLSQYLTVSWVWPLLKIGKNRQLQTEDVWLLGFMFQSRRLASAFRQVKGSSVFRRLLKANILDCTIIWAISCVEMTLGKD
jgi:hypothetical protein